MKTPEELATEAVRECLRPTFPGGQQVGPTWPLDRSTLQFRDIVARYIAAARAEGVAAGRREMAEEAARVAEGYCGVIRDGQDYRRNDLALRIAADVRALADKEPKA